MTFVPRPSEVGGVTYNPSLWQTGSRLPPSHNIYAPYVERPALTERETIGDDILLLHAGMSPPIIHKIMAIAAQWGVSPIEAALALRAIDPDAFVTAMASAAGLRYLRAYDSIKLRNIDPSPDPYRLLKSWQAIPLDASPYFAVNARAFSADSLSLLAETLGRDSRRLVVVDQPALSNALAMTYSRELTQEAEDGLRRRHPRFCAASGLWRWQLAAIGTIVGLFLGACVFAPRETLSLYTALLSLMFFLTIALRALAAGHACYRRFSGKRRRIRKLADKDLPYYTVLVALYREARVLPDLIAHLKRLNYPPAKLDIKLVLEVQDYETIDAANAADLPPHFEVLIVPNGSPRTKPRALNYAAQFARGDYLVIYDAEDRPEPDQLRKAAGHFHDAPAEVVCLQACLTYDNFSENWLARQGSIEYASLFGGILPMLDAAKLPLPLGGTSNHFRIKALRGVGGWDAHNVTEDADLGMRLYRAGLRAEVLDSTTYEEAACQPGNWIRQRTRWLKGWLQTYVVHMRQPMRLINDLGMPGFLAFQGHFAGVLIAALLHPLAYLLIAHDLATGIMFSPNTGVVGHHLWLLAIFNLIAGYVVALALGCFVLYGPRKRLIPDLLLIPIYWLFISVAAYRAVYQFFTAPQFWEKTEHGLSECRGPSSHQNYVENKASEQPVRF
jgi:glycosyltransferase XagB